MKYILPTLSIIILLVSCNLKAQRKSPPLVLPPETISMKIVPEPFIQELPYELNENSGLIYYDGLLWSFNDSGGENIVYGIDFNGDIQKTIELENAENIDWEEIAQDEKHIYIGDFGNNNGNRKNLKIYKIDKDDLDKKNEKIKADIIEIKYADQESFNFSMQITEFDCEAMAELNDHLYLFSKDWKNQITTVYKVPKKEGKYHIEPLAKFNVNGLVTGADFSPDKKSLVLVGYRDYVPFLWMFSDFEDDNFFSGEKSFIQMESISDAQTEGVCFLNNDILLISCEQSGSFRQQVFLFNTKTMKMYGTHEGESND